MMGQTTSERLQVQLSSGLRRVVAARLDQPHGKSLVALAQGYRAHKHRLALVLVDDISSGSGKDVVGH